MIKKILNPKRFYSEIELSNLPIVKVEDEYFRLLVKDERKIIASCQCFKDCDCVGKTNGKVVSYYRNLSLDGTDKCFVSDQLYKPVGIKENIV